MKFAVFAFALGLLGVAHGSGPFYGYGYKTNFPDRGDGKCDCTKYLGDAWKKLEKLIGLQDICCIVGAQIYDDYVFYKYKFDGYHRERSLTEEEKANRILDSLDLSEDELSQLAKELYQIEEENRELEQEIPEPEAEKAVEEAPGYDAPSRSYGGYNKGCSYDPNWPKIYVNCIINMNFQQAVEACYCWYRSYKKCTYKDTCDQKTWKIDVYVAGNPFNACKQCPDGKEYRYDGKPEGYNPHRKLAGYGKGTPYKYDKGSTFEECLGYCFIADSYHAKYKFLSKGSDSYH